MEKKYILTEHVAEMKLRRMAFEIIENNREEKKDQKKYYFISNNHLENGRYISFYVNHVVLMGKQLSSRMGFPSI